MKKTKEVKKINYRKILRKTVSVLYGIVFALLIFVALILILSTFDIPGSIKLYSVQSGSMEPSIHLGSIVIDKPMSSYQVNDVITFKEAANPQITITHRINAIDIKQGQTYYVTKGDANNAVDTDNRPASSVLGKVIYSIPVLGYVVSFAKTGAGLILLIIIPTLIIIVSELISIRDEVQKLLEERKKKKLSLTKKIELEIGEEEIKAEQWYKRLINKVKLFFKTKTKSSKKKKKKQ